MTDTRLQETVDGVPVDELDGLVIGWRYICEDCETEFYAQTGAERCSRCGSGEVCRPHEF